MSEQALLARHKLCERRTWDRGTTHSVEGRAGASTARRDVEKSMNTEPPSILQSRYCPGRPTGVLERKPILRTFASISFAILLSSCGLSTSTAPALKGSALTVMGIGDQHQEAPARNALIYAFRQVEGCPANAWLLMEAGSEIVDSQLVRTDRDGNYTLQPATYPSRCTGSIRLTAKAYVPGYASSSDMKGQVKLVSRASSPARASELAQVLQSDRYGMGEAWMTLHEEMRPEAEAFVGETLDAWLRECAQRDVCYR